MTEVTWTPEPATQKTGQAIEVDEAVVENLSDIRKLSALLAKLHLNSMLDPKAPKEFGYHVMTYEGSMHQDIA
ncbi:hypothetical protein J4E91_005915 [Alternaria rosae]|nr:hypothetical protein J4E91_005915 [Alternaria rosae]